MSFKIEIASDVIRDILVAEIWWKDVLVAELFRDSDNILQINLYPSESDAPCSFGLASWREILSEAERKLG